MFRTIVAALSLLSLSMPAKAGVLYVDPSGVGPGNQPAFTTIQAAVNAASPGTTIDVDAATYTENVTITTPGLTLNGAQAGVNPVFGRSGPESILDGSITITVPASGVTVDGFTVDANSQWAIEVGGPPAPTVLPTNSIIEDNIVYSTIYGIQVGPTYLQTPLYSTVRDNVIQSANAAIYVFTTSYTTITGNKIDESSFAGIDIYYSYNSTISYNAVNNSNPGIRLRGDQYDLVEYNQGSGNTMPPLQEDILSSDNTLIHNFDGFNAVPEPASFILALTGFGLLAGWRFRLRTISSCPKEVEY